MIVAELNAPDRIRLNKNFAFFIQAQFVPKPEQIPCPRES